MTRSLEDCVVQLEVESRWRVVSKSLDEHWHRKKTKRVFVNRGGRLLEIPIHNLGQRQSKRG